MSAKKKLALTKLNNQINEYLDSARKNPSQASRYMYLIDVVKVKIKNIKMHP